MIPRICLQKDIRSSRAIPCSVTELVKAMKDPAVQRIADQIKTLQNGEEYDKDLIQAYKQQLPAITPHACRFDKDKRKSEGATASGLVMLDVDHVDPQEPDREVTESPRSVPQPSFSTGEYMGDGLLVTGSLPQGHDHKCTLPQGYDRQSRDGLQVTGSHADGGSAGEILKQVQDDKGSLAAYNLRRWGLPTDEKFYKENGIYFVAVTPSGHGLRVIGERQQGETLERGMARLASLLGIVEYDSCTKDLARLSYLMPWSYVLYFDSDGFVWENPSDPSQGERGGHAGQWADAGYWLRREYQLQLPTALEQKELREEQTEAQERRSGKRDIYPDSYDGLPYEQIIKQLLIAHKVDEKGPKVGQRNIVYYKLALDLRYICDFEADFIYHVLPDWGLPENERRSTIRSALGTPKRSNFPDLLQGALIAVRQMQEDENKAEALDIRKYSPEDLEMPRLPKVLQVICRRLPKSYHPAMVIASLPILGALATSVRMKYIDGQTHSLSFMSCIAAPSGTGKSFIRQPIDLLMTPINEHDEEERRKQEEYKEALKKAKNSKQQPEDPHACPRNNGINISVAALLKLMYYSGEKHLIAIGEEIDTLAKSEKAGVWSQKSDIYRLAFDNAKYGQQYISENSFSAYVNVYYNLLITGTLGGMYKFFNNVENGLVSRVAFATLPDMFATSIPKFEQYTETEREYVIEVARRLDSSSGEVSCKKVYEAMEQWQEEKRQLAELTDSRAVDSLRRRACVMGFRAGMLAYLLEGMKGAKLAADFGVWVAEYVFRQQMTLFGELFEKSYRDQTRQAEGNRGNVRNLLAQLPNEFSTADFIAIRRKNGQSADVRRILSRWTLSGLIKKTGEKKYQKLTAV